MVTVNRASAHYVRARLRHALVALSLISAPLMPVAPAAAQVGINIAVPGISIGIHQPFYPELVLVPGTPVYYAPHAHGNYFFYDGLFWVYQDDRWYASAWYDGPWDLVDPYHVPLFVLRVPVQYYLRPPVYFYGWVVTAPPRWDIHWGPRWAQHRHGWNHWNHRAIPHPAPPPVYQRHYSGDRYPRPEYQHDLREQHYRHQSRDAAVRRQIQQRLAPPVPAPVQIMPPARMDAPRAQFPQRDRDDERRLPAQTVPQPREPLAQGPQSRLEPQEQHRPALQGHDPRRQEMQHRHMRGPESEHRVPMAPPPGRENPTQAQRQVIRQEASQAQRESAPQPMRQHETQGRRDDQPRGNPDRGRGQERGR